MSNTRSIQPINAWSNQGVRTATKIKLANFNGYYFTADSGGSVAWAIIDEFDYPVADGIMNIPAEVVQNWGADDEVMFDYVISQLGLTKVTP